MLPPDLTGPSSWILHDLDCAFVQNAAQRYSELDPDFVRQICYEHPVRFNDLYPRFDVAVHGAYRIFRSAGWLYDSVREDDGSLPDSWSGQFDGYLARGQREYFVYETMIGTGRWPFPPVIVSAETAVDLGRAENLGFPYALVEGYHRLSYMRRMVQLGLLDRDTVLDAIELREQARGLTDTSS